MCLTTGLAGLAGCSDDDPGRATNRLKPNEIPLDTTHAQKLGDPVALRRHLALPDAQVDEMQYTSADSAAAVVSAWWKSQRRYNVAVLTTSDGWKRAAGALIPEAAWVRALPGGSVAVVPQPERLPSFVLHPDGTFAQLRISVAVRQPALDDVLVTEPEGISSPSNATIWAIDVGSAAMFPAASQPCKCDELYVSGPVPSGAVTYVAVFDWSRNSYGRRPPGQVRFMLTRDNGIHWSKPTRAEQRQMRGSWQIPQGGWGWAGLRGNGTALVREMTRELASNHLLTLGVWRGVNDRWHRDLLDRPRRLAGIATTAEGELLMLDRPRRRLATMTSGGRLRPLRGGPTGIYGLQAAGDLYLAYGPDLNVATSSDGTTWTPTSIRNAAIVDRPLAGTTAAH